MLIKGSYSFVIMMVINPVLLLFFQNCSMTERTYASESARKADPSPQTVRQKIESSGFSKACQRTSQHCLMFEDQAGRW